MEKMKWSEKKESRLTNNPCESVKTLLWILNLSVLLLKRRKKKQIRTINPLVKGENCMEMVKRRGFHYFIVTHHIFIHIPVDIDSRQSTANIFSVILLHWIGMAEICQFSMKKWCQQCDMDIPFGRRRVEKRMKMSVKQIIEKMMKKKKTIVSETYNFESSCVIFLRLWFTQAIETRIIKIHGYFEREMINLQLIELKFILFTIFYEDWRWELCQIIISRQIFSRGGERERESKKNISSA